MKIAALSLIILSTLSMQAAHAMSKNIARLSDERVDDVEIQKSFNLRATDGSVLKFKSMADLNDGAGLPAPVNADTSLCGQLADLELFTGTIQIALDLGNQYRPLKEKEIEFLKRVPHCDPYDSGLNLIATYIRINTPGYQSGESMASFSKKSDKHGTYLVLKTESKKQAAFKISAGLDKIREVKDLPRLQILASQSGQNLGIRFKLVSASDQEPRQTRDWESCEYTHYERQCRYDRERRREVCEDVRITEEGRRRVISTHESTFYTIGFEMIDLKGQVVAVGEMYDLDSDSSERYGACEPIHSGRGRH